jgi:serine/threonine protein kinase
MDTTQHIAPEVFSGTGYERDCDWWSLGTIMFEFQVGWPLFVAADASDTYRKIINWRQTLYFPVDIQLGPEAENLMRRYGPQPCLRMRTNYKRLVLSATRKIALAVGVQMR